MATIDGKYSSFFPSPRAGQDARRNPIVWYHPPPFRVSTLMNDHGPRINRLDGDREKLLYAISLFRERRIDDSRAEAEKILLVNDRFLPAVLGVGITYLAQRKGREALRYFERAAAIDPMAPTPLVLSG